MRARVKVHTDWFCSGLYISKYQHGTLDKKNLCEVVKGNYFFFFLLFSYLYIY